VEPISNQEIQIQILRQIPVGFTIFRSVFFKPTNKGFNTLICFFSLNQETNGKVYVGGTFYGGNYGK